MQSSTSARDRRLPDRRILDFDVYDPAGSHENYHAAWSPVTERSDVGLDR